MKNLKRTVALMLVLIMAFAVTGCTKTVKTASTIEGSEGSDYVIGWEEEDVSGTDVLNSDAAGSNSSSTSSSGSSSSSGTNTSSSVFTPEATFDVYKNIPKNVKQIKILLWYTPDKTEQAVFDAFEKKFGIKVKTICTDNAGYLTKLTTLVASNDAPDVAALYDFPAPVVKGLFQTIDSVMADKGGAFDLKRDPAIDLDAMKYMAWNGKQYGVQLKGNWYSDRWVIIFNRTLFKNRGITDPYTLWKQNKWNWTTFEQAAKDMTYKNNGIQVYGFGPGMENALYGLLASAGKNIVTINNDKGTIANNSADNTVISAATLLTRIRSAGQCVPNGSDWSMFTKGQCAMWLTSHTQVKKGREFDSMTDDWTTVPVPSPEGKEMIVPYGTTGFGIPKGSKNAIAGSYLIRWLLDSNNWDIRATFSTQEMYDNWVEQQKYKACFVTVGPIINNASGLGNSLNNVTWGNVNDVATGLKSLSGNIDSAIKTTVNEMGKQ